MNARNTSPLGKVRIPKFLTRIYYRGILVDEAYRITKTGMEEPFSYKGGKARKRVRDGKEKDGEKIQFENSVLSMGRLVTGVAVKICCL
jgi:hypothetical protein